MSTQNTEASPQKNSLTNTFEDAKKKKPEELAPLIHAPREMEFDKMEKSFFNFIALMFTALFNGDGYEVMAYAFGLNQRGDAPDWERFDSYDAKKSKDENVRAAIENAFEEDRRNPLSTDSAMNPDFLHFLKDNPTHIPYFHSVLQKIIDHNNIPMVEHKLDPALIMNYLYTTGSFKAFDNEDFIIDRIQKLNQKYNGDTRTALLAYDARIGETAIDGILAEAKIDDPEQGKKNILPIKKIMPYILDKRAKEGFDNDSESYDIDAIFDTIVETSAGLWPPEKQKESAELAQKLAKTLKLQHHSIDAEGRMSLKDAFNNAEGEKKPTKPEVDTAIDNASLNSVPVKLSP